MRWELSEDQMLFRDALHGWLERLAPTRDVKRWLDTADCAPFDARFAADGWFSAGTPEASGGSGGGLLELALAAEQLGRAVAPSATWLASVIAAPALPREVAEACLSGGQCVAAAVSASGPADARGPVQVADGRLSGTIPLVLGAAEAHRFLVPAGDGSEARLYLIDAGEATVSRRPLVDRSRSTADVSLAGVKGTELDVVAPDELLRMALRAAVLTAADSLGLAERVLELAVEYSKQRVQFGAPIGSFQAVKHAAAMMLVTVESARTLVYYAAAAVEEQHEDYIAHAAAAKAQVCAAAARAVDSALVIHGAIGYTWEHDLHLFYKRAKLNEHLFGRAEVWNERLAQQLPLVPVPAGGR